MFKTQWSKNKGVATLNRKKDKTRTVFKNRHLMFCSPLQRGTYCTSARRLGNLAARRTAGLLSPVVAEEDDQRHQKNGSEADTDDDALYVDPAFPGTLLHGVFVRYGETKL